MRSKGSFGPPGAEHLALLHDAGLGDGWRLHGVGVRRAVNGVYPSSDAVSLGDKTMAGSASEVYEPASAHTISKRRYERVESSSVLPDLVLPLRLSIIKSCPKEKTHGQASL